MSGRGDRSLSVKPPIASTGGPKGDVRWRISNPDYALMELAARKPELCHSRLNYHCANCLALLATHAMRDLIDARRIIESRA